MQKKYWAIIIIVAVILVVVSIVTAAITVMPFMMIADSIDEANSQNENMDANIDNVMTYPQVMAFVEKHPSYTLENPINFGTEIEYTFVAGDGSLSVTTYNDGSTPNMLYKCYDNNSNPMYSGFSFGDSLVQDIMTLC